MEKAGLVGRETGRRARATGLGTGTALSGIRRRVQDADQKSLSIYA